MNSAETSGLDGISGTVSERDVVAQTSSHESRNEKKGIKHSVV